MPSRGGRGPSPPHRLNSELPKRRERYRIAVSLWCRDSAVRFLLVISQNAILLSLFSSLTLFLAFAVRLAALAGPGADLAVWVFLRVVKTR